MVFLFILNFEFGFTNPHIVPSLFIEWDGWHIIFLLIYVDDIII